MLSWIIIIAVIIMALGVAIYLYDEEITKLEICVIVLVGVLSGMCMKYICFNVYTSDTEWLGGYVESATYYEAWDEEVPCQHPIYCTRRVRQGKVWRTEEYVCGHEHPYDVEYHSPDWRMNTTLGNMSISEDRFHKLCKRWNNKSFVNMHRDFHKIDGDAYRTYFDNDFKHLEAVSVSHSYENKTMVSKSVYNYPDIDKEEADSLGLYHYDYNGWEHYHNSLYSNKVAVSGRARGLLKQYNGRLGHDKQCRLYFLIFKNKDQSIATEQEAYWKGGNKNEFVVCLNVNDFGTITWSRTFTWSEATEINADIDSYLRSADSINQLDTIVATVGDKLYKGFKRKEFSDFDYLSVSLRWYHYLWIFMGTLIATGIAVYVSITNEVRNNKRKPNDYGY